MRLPAVPTASMSPRLSRTSTMRPSVSLAPHSSSAAVSAVAPSEGCGWLSGIALLCGAVGLGPRDGEA